MHEDKKTFHIDADKKAAFDGQSSNLITVLATQAKLKDLKAYDIQFSEPILRQGDNAVIFPHTINVIQGQAGVHKSRLAEIISSSFLLLPGCDSELLGFRRSSADSIYTVVYVDTERNLTEQLPFALQCIQIKAGYKKADHPKNFEYISLLQIARKERFEVLSEYLHFVKQSTDNPLFIVLDVSTDCIEDFNKTDKSMELIDLMNVIINKYDVTFLCIIHENPNSDKARGHFGTELKNKASTHIQVGFEKDGSQNYTDIIRVKYLKCRTTKTLDPFHVRYSDEAKGLVLADAGEVSEVINSRKLKATIDDIIESIVMYLGDGLPLARPDLLGKLCKDFDAGTRTIEDRISEIMTSKAEIVNEKGETCILSKEKQDRVVYYKLIPNETE